MKNPIKSCFFVAAFITLIFVSGCDLTPEAKVAIHQGNITAQEESRNFEAVKDKLTAKDPADVANIEAWKTLHSQALAEAAKAMADVDTRVNGPSISNMAGPIIPAQPTVKEMKKPAEKPFTYWGDNH